jgi:uncharacterized protein
MVWSSLAKQSPLVRVLVFLSGAVILWAPLAWPLYQLSGQGLLPGGDLIPTALLYGVFLGLLPRWQRRVHRVRHPWQRIGFTGARRLWRGLWIGGLIGILSLIVLVLVQLGLGWAVMNTAALKAQNLMVIALTGALAALAVGWSEEVLFRGWLLGELEQGYSAGMALGLSSMVFALAHFIKPLEAILGLLPQFLGLLVLGITLVWARRSHLGPGPKKTSLGPAVGLHSGLVWGYYIINVGDLIQPTHRVPAWVTGLDGNPLAGLLGIALLMGLAAVFYRWSHRSSIDGPLE